MDPNKYKHLHMTLNLDGSITRNYPVPLIPPSGHDHENHDATSLSKDVPLNPARNTSIRIFIPIKYTTSTANMMHAHLPLIIYFHAGGFVLCSPSISPVHKFTSLIASQLPAIVLSVDHRLAPEHRLPAAYDDALDALLWVRHQALLPLDEMRGPWLKHADFSRCFLMGSSSGGNIAYHLALRSSALELGPVKIAGVIMDQPFFGGEERTESEVRMAEDSIVPLSVTDTMWELALPVGACRDHEYSKPQRSELMKMKKAHKISMPRCLVRGYIGDPLIDRMRMVAEMLEEEGVEVVSMLEEEGYHGVELYDSTKADQMMLDIKSFLNYNKNFSVVKDDDGVVVGALVVSAPKFCEQQQQQCEQSIETSTVEVM